MTQAWCTLTTVDGKTVSAPDEEQLAPAVAAVYRHRTSGPDDDAASAALSFGYDDGLMYVAHISGNGELSFEEWSDRDCELALATPRRMHASEQQALEVWLMICRRQVAKIRALAWQSGP